MQRLNCVTETGNRSEIWHGTSCPWRAQTQRKPTGPKGFCGRYLIHSPTLTHSHAHTVTVCWFRPAISLRLCVVPLHQFCHFLLMPMAPLSIDTHTYTHTWRWHPEWSDILRDNMSRWDPLFRVRPFPECQRTACSGSPMWTDKRSETQEAVAPSWSKAAELLLRHLCLFLLRCDRTAKFSQSVFLAHQWRRCKRKEIFFISLHITPAPIWIKKFIVKPTKAGSLTKSAANMKMIMLMFIPQPTCASGAEI